MSDLTTHFKSLDLDIRKKPLGYSRFMDQKVTPDVLSFIADCILNYLDNKAPNNSFTTKDIWKSQYFIKNTVAFFGKPSPSNKNASAEYDKFIAQPIKALAFGKILREVKVGNRNEYTVVDPELLENIGQSEKNAFKFLAVYIEKVLTDSGFIGDFENYKKKADKKTITEKDFQNLKTDFQKFMLGNTEINGKVEINRIFPKVLNPYAVSHGIPGSESGRMTTDRFVYADLMYNRQNFRDISKGKTITRKEALSKISTAQVEKYKKYQSERAKASVRRRHSPTSEIKDSLSNGKAIQVHHMFSESDFPEIADYVENLILLTAQQHNTRAHPNNKTQVVDVEYQKECLLSKLQSVENSINRGDGFYSKEQFIHVLNVGYKLNLPTTTSFEQLKKLIRER